MRNIDSEIVDRLGVYVYNKYVYTEIQIHKDCKCYIWFNGRWNKAQGYNNNNKNGARGA